MNLSDFDYELPPELIAQHPLKKRDESKLMVLNRANQTIEHHQFFELPDLIDENSVLVFNESRVIPARLKFKINEKEVEILLIKQLTANSSPLTAQKWECMVKPGKLFKADTAFKIDDECSGQVKEITANGLRVIQFEATDFNQYLKSKGEMPTPPYVKEQLEEKERYQTVYSKTEGSVAAPTAGFHFTPKLFEKLKQKGVQIEFVTLHVGLGTFQPVKTDSIEEHEMHSEWFQLDEQVADRLNKAKQQGKKIIAVGTTSVRVLESCAQLTSNHSLLTSQMGETDIFIYPGYQWKFVDQLITNFHVPKSTLLMLVSSLASRDFILKAYEAAKQNKYRFFSFGDSMWIQ